MQGLSIATDPYGRMLAYQDYYSNTPRLSIVGVPSRGVRTIYAICGELFSIVCIVLFVGLIAFAYLNGGSTLGQRTIDRVATKISVLSESHFGNGILQPHLEEQFP